MPSEELLMYTTVNFCLIFLDITVLVWVAGYKQITAYVKQ